MKKALFLLVLIIGFGCSSDDDNNSSFDRNLLLGTWYDTGLCRVQNSIIYNNSGSYVRLFSGAVNCNDPEPDTYQTEGSYQVNGDFIKYNLTSTKLINDGTNLSVTDIENINVTHEIMELSKTRLVIKSYIERDNNHIETLATTTYEH